jgi:asparagine synthase (glutamine-hydrolysing)
VKPLYYAERGGRLTFASEIKALIADPDLPREVDLTALDWFLTYRFVPSPRTMLAAVRKVSPGHFLRVASSGSSLVRFAPRGLGPSPRVTEAEAVELVRDAFSAAVERQMVSDVPIGALLSGGVDSGAIVAAMAECSTRVRTYTVGFADGGEFNELAEAREVATLFGTDHHELVVSAKEYVDSLARVIWHLDEPISTSSCLPLYFITGVARGDVKVVLAGQGADEPFGGYRRYLGERYRHLWSSLPAGGRTLGQQLMARIPRAEALKRAGRSLAIADDAERFRQIYAVFPDALKDRLLRPDVRGNVAESSVEPIRGLLGGLEQVPSLARLQYVDARLSLADDLLMYGDKMSMANSIEMRVPFLDRELMQLVERLPPELKIKGTSGKHIWKRAAGRWLPPHIIKRPKRGFATPIDQWFRGSLNPFVRETLLGDRAAARRYFDLAVLGRLIADHQAGRENYQRQLFSLLCFEIWHQQFVGAA